MPKKYLTSKLVKFILAIAICLLFIFFIPEKFTVPVRAIFLKAAYPFQKTFYVLSGKTRDFFYLLSSISDLKNKNEKLTEENNRLWARVSDLEGQKKENENLRNQLELAPRQNYKLEASLVIGQDPHGPGSWIIADKGRSKGIESGMPVIISEGILVGKVGEVYDQSSQVILLTDSKSSVNVTDLATGAKGILMGEYNLGLILGMVEQTEILNIGDDIVTSGLGGLMPKGFLIGKIQQVGGTRDKLFQEALVIPKVDYRDLEMVFIVKE
jgi:rod shape-determining protein MreC